MIGSDGPIAAQAATRTPAIASDADTMSSGVGSPARRISGLVLDPLVEADHARQRPPSAQASAEPAGPAPRAAAASGDPEQQQEADMDRAHDLARQSSEVGGGRELEGREGDGDPEEHPADPPGGSARRVDELGGGGGAHRHGPLGRRRTRRAGATG